MEELRMNALFKHVDKMNKALITMLDNYRNYSERKKPTICVLCSDNQLRAEVDKSFTAKEDMCIEVIVTSEEINDAEKYKAMLCDALVVCTRAKNIAPKGLYDLVKHISLLDKQIYVVLAGWESVERSEKMAKLKAKRVAVEFEFARVMNVTNVFHMPCAGFSTWDDALGALSIQFSEKYESLHQNQDEKIYNYLMGDVEDFYANARTEINNEIAALNDVEKRVMAKQDYYGVRFSNLAVSVQDVVDSVRASIEDISYYDIVDDEKNETLTDKYSRSGLEAQMYAKVFLIQEYKKRISALKDNNNERVRLDNESCVAECINEMDLLLCDVSKLSFLPGNLVDCLRTACEERTELEKIVNRYASSTKNLINGIIERIPSRVGEYRYEMRYSVEVRDASKDLLAMARKKVNGELGSDAKEDTSDSVKMYDETMEKENEALMLDRFQNDIEQLIFYSRNACGEMAQDCARIVKQDMEQFADSVLKIYFGSIIKEIESMNAEMNKVLEEYYWE